VEDRRAWGILPARMEPFAISVPDGAADELRALLRHARALIGVTLTELADGLGLPVPVGRIRSKGWSGQIIERELGASGGRGQDFAGLGVELKSVPVDAGLRPLESTAVCQIDPVAIAGESWGSSYLRSKLARVLFVALQVPHAPTSVGDRRVVAVRLWSPSPPTSVGDRRVVAVRLWSPSPAQDALLRADFELFVREYFRRGRAAEISGHQGRVLQVRPKGRNAADLRSAFDSDGRPVWIGKCGFYLRPDFVGQILRDGEEPR
jgi:DNA mismatch repair protein MutH